MFSKEKSRLTNVNSFLAMCLHIETDSSLALRQIHNFIQDLNLNHGFVHFYSKLLVHLSRLLDTINKLTSGVQNTEYGPSSTLSGVHNVQFAGGCQRSIGCHEHVVAHNSGSGVESSVSDSGDNSPSQSIDQSHHCRSKAGMKVAKINATRQVLIELAQPLERLASPPVVTVRTFIVRTMIQVGNLPVHNNNCYLQNWSILETSDFVSFDG